MGRQFHFFMGEKEELKRYLLDSNVKILFEGKNPTPVEITEFPPAFSDRGWFMVYLYKEEWGELVMKDVLNGGLPNEAYCMEEIGGKWYTYYSERGQRTFLKAFKTEQEACSYFLDWIKNH